MKREFLKNLGLADDVIDSIMAEHGTSTQKIRDDLKNATDNLKTANDKIASFGDVEAIKADVEKYKADYQKAVDNHDKYVAEQEFTKNLNDGLSAYKPRDVKALTPYLDMEKLKSSKNFSEDLKIMIEPLQKDKAWLFVENKQHPQFTDPDGSGYKVDNNNSNIDKLRSIMGLPNDKN